MKKRTKRLLSILISAMLIIGTLPLVSVATAGDGKLDFSQYSYQIRPDGYYVVETDTHYDYVGPYTATGDDERVVDVSKVEFYGNDTEAVNYELTLENVRMQVPYGYNMPMFRTIGNVNLKLFSKGNCVLYGDGGPLFFPTDSVFNQANGLLNLHVEVAYGTLALIKNNSPNVLVPDGTAYSFGPCTQANTGSAFDNINNNELIAVHNATPNNDGTHTCHTEGCAFKDQKLPCAYNEFIDMHDGTHKAICEVCGGELIQDHEGTDNYKDLPNKQHQLLCDKCGGPMGPIEDCDMTGPFVENSNGTHVRICSKCYQPVTDPEPCAFGEWMPDGSDAHVRECQICHALEWAPHVFTKRLAEITPAGPGKPGEATYECGACGQPVDAVSAPTDAYLVYIDETYDDGYEGASIEILVNGESTIVDNPSTNPYMLMIPDTGTEPEIAILLNHGACDDEFLIGYFAPNEENPRFLQRNFARRQGDDQQEIIYINYKLADRTPAMEALKNIPKDLDQYSPESVNALMKAKENLPSLLEKDQAIVDAKAAEIQNAIDALVPYEPASSYQQITLKNEDILKITKTGYSINDAEEVPYQGAYTISGKAKQVVVDAGVDIQLKDLSVRNREDSAFILMPGSVVHLELIGRNILSSRSAENFAGLNAPENTILSIFGTGELIAEGGDDAAGIGGSDHQNAGYIFIHSGDITATSEGDGAGIGGGYKGNAGLIKIYGGTIYAECIIDDGAGIGCGDDGDGGEIYIYGGHITALSKDDDGAGIGGADEGTVDAIYISGGTIYAESDDGAGIGSGDSTDNKKIVITGGNITVKSRDGAGIGGGRGEQGGQISISNAIINIDPSCDNGIGADDSSSSGFDDFVHLDYVAIHGATLEDMKPRATTSDGKPVVALTQTHEGEDGLVGVKLPDGTNMLANAKDGKIIVFVPEENNVDKTFTVVSPDADYSAVDTALAKIPADLSIYTDESVAAVNAAKDAVVRGYYLDKQSEVDAMAAGIEAAVAGLTLKPGEVAPTPGETTPDPQNPSADPDKTNPDIPKTGGYYEEYLQMRAASQRAEDALPSVIGTLMASALGLVALVFVRRKKENI